MRCCSKCASKAKKKPILCNGEGSETTSLYAKCETQSVVFPEERDFGNGGQSEGSSTETPICDTTPAANFNTDLFTKLKPEPNYIAERLTNTDGARTAQLVPETGSPLALSLTNAGTDGPLDVVFDTVNRVAVWSQLEYRASDFDVTGEESEAYAAIVGGDYLVRDNLLVGALLAVDHSEVETSGATNEAETDGYMVGPYFAYLTSNGFVLAGRVLYGTSETDVVLATSSDTGSYDTERSFYGLSLSSPQFVTGNTSVSYGAEVYYVDYSSDAYTATGSSDPQPRQDQSRTGLDLNVEAQFLQDTDFVPFTSAELNFIDDDPSSTLRDDVSGTVRAGFFAYVDDASFFRGELGYAGIGDDDFSAVSAELRYQINF